MDALLAEGEHERALEAFFREIVRMPDHEFERYHALPAWQARIAAAHTITREDQGEPFDPEEAKKITVPVLLMVGGDSPPAMQADYETVAAALPDARVTVMDGQQHIAIDLIPEEFARRVLTFLR